MITDSRITLLGKEYKHRNSNNVPVTTALKQQLVRIITANKRK